MRIFKRPAVLVFLSLWAIGGIFLLTSCQPDRTYQRVGIIKNIEIIARSWNANDKMILTMEDGSQFVLTYRGENYHSGQILLRNAKGHFQIEEEQR